MKYFFVLAFLLIAVSQVASDALSSSYNPPSDTDLCDKDALQQPATGKTERVTVNKYDCYVTHYKKDCSEKPEDVIVLEKGKVNVFTSVNDYGFGLLLTGDQVCFSWNYEKETYYGGNFNYEEKCYEQCVDIGKELEADTYYVANSYDDPVEKSYRFTTKKGSASSLVPLVSLVAVMIASLLL